MNAQPLAVGVMMTSRGQGGKINVAAVAATDAIELRNGAKFALDKAGKMLQSGEVLVLKIVTNLKI